MKECPLNDHRMMFTFGIARLLFLFKNGSKTIPEPETLSEGTVIDADKKVEIPEVEAGIGNNAPTAGIGAELKKSGVMTLISSSSDPDGDDLEHRFNFGEGNLTDWIDQDEAKHHYSKVGTYNCSLIERDSKGAISDRSFVLVEVKTVSNATIDEEEAGSNDDHPILIIAVITIAAVAMVIVALMMMVIFIIVLKKRKVEKEKGEVENW